MSDKKKTEVSVMPEFVSGEQPTAAKFNAMGSLIKRESFVLEKAIGDIWGESEPYSTYSSNLLSIPLFQSSVRNILTNASDLHGRGLDIASLGRAIGPMSKLNPKILTDGLNDTYGDLSNIVETIGANPGFQYSLRYKPSGSSFVFSDTAVFATPKPVEDLKNAGDYAIDQNKGIIYTVSEIVTGSTIAYSVKPSEWSGGSSYTGSSFNTIPDINQIGVDDLIISQPIGSVYEITFPEISIQGANYDESSTALNENDINHLGKYKLPASIIAVCGGDYLTGSGAVSDSIIPEGMIYLRNMTTGEIHSDGVYYYNNDHSIKVANVTLDLNDNYYLITTGTDITSSIEDLGKKQFKHKHSREFGEPLVSVKDLDEIYDDRPTSGNYVPSTIPGNHFSQYLHRDGFNGLSESQESAMLNDHNSMRGTLLMGKDRISYSGTFTSGDYLKGGSSFPIVFGYDDSTSSYAFGPKIYNEAYSNKNVLRIYGKESFLGETDIWVESKNRLLLQSDEGVVDVISTTDDVGINAGASINAHATDNVNVTADNNVVLDAQNYNIADEGLVMKHRTSGVSVGTNIGSWAHPAIKCVVYESSSTGDRFYGYKYPDSSRPQTDSEVNYLEREFEMVGVPSTRTVLGYQCLVSCDKFHPNHDTLQSWIVSNIAQNAIVDEDWIPVNASHPTMTIWSWMNNSWGLSSIVDWILNTIGLGNLVGGPPSIGSISYNSSTRKFRVGIGVDFTGALGHYGPSHFSKNQTSPFKSNNANERYVEIRTKIIVWYR